MYRYIYKSFLRGSFATIKATKQPLKFSPIVNHHVPLEKYYNLNEHKLTNTFLADLSNLNPDQLSHKLQDFLPELDKMTDLYALKRILIYLAKLGKLKNQDFIHRSVQTLRKNEENMKIFPLTEKIGLLKILVYFSKQSEDELPKEIKLYVESVLNTMKDMKKSEFLSLDRQSIINLLYLIQSLDIINHDLIVIQLIYFKTNVADYSETDFIKTLFQLVKLYAYIEKSHFLNQVNHRNIMDNIKQVIFETPGIQTKIKQFILNNRFSIFNISNLLWSLSRIDYQNNEVWQLLVDYFAINYKKIDDSNFKSMLSSLTAHDKIQNMFLLTEFKSHFDTRIHDNLKTIQVDYFVRGLRSFLSRNAIINNKDFSWPLYEKFIKERLNTFDLTQSISLMYILAQANYQNNSKIVDIIITKVISHLNDFTMKNQENLSLFFWGGSILMTNNEQFWNIYQKYLSIINFEYMNDKNLINNVMPIYYLQNYEKKYIKNQNLLDEQQKQLNLLAFHKVYIISYPKARVKLINGFDFYALCQAIELKIYNEILVEVHPVDYFIENFYEIDFNDKIKNIKKYVNKYNILNNQQGNNKEGEQQNLKCFTNFIENNQFLKENKKKGLIVEIHGLTHFIMEEEYTKGPTAMKIKVIADAGYNLLVLNYSKCEELGNIADLEGKMLAILSIFKELKREYAEKTNCNINT